MRIFCLFSLLLTCSLLRGQEPKTRMTPDDLLSLKDVREVEVSPDSKWIAYTVTSLDTVKDKSVTQLWMVPAEGGEALPMTSGEYSAGNPRWSPDGKYLSFMAARGEKAKTQVWTLNRLGGEARQLTRVKQGVSGYEWSPDGKRLALLIRDPKPEELTEDEKDDKKPKPHVIDRLQFKRDYQGYLDRYRTHLYTFTPGDSAAVQLTFGDFDDSAPAWSPDGRTIAFVSNRSKDPDGNDNTDIWTVSTDTPGPENLPKQVTNNAHADDSPRWSPDGKSLAYLTVTDGPAIWYATNKLAIIPAAGGTPRLLTGALDRNVSDPKFAPDGKAIYFLLEENGTQVLASVNPAGNGLKRVVAGEISIGDYALAGDQIALLLGKSLQPNEIFGYRNGQLRKLTETNDALLSKFPKPLVERIRFTSADGTPVEGFVVKPPGFTPGVKYPTLLWIHGGPVSQYDHSFHPPSQLFAANGYVTLLLNPRGSSGYGQAFSQAIFADWGTKDYQDVMAGVDFAIQAGYADPDRLGVGGWSYGGILTNYVITKTDRFKAALSGASEALYRANYGHDHYQFYWEKELGLPWETPEAWERISPFNDVDKITTPTLWMGGAEDWNVPILNSEQMYQAMKRLGRETQLVVYPGEHHGIRRPSFQKDRWQRWLDWFGNYLKPTQP
jgi:dipeptidyl aminopeptidase/acylaminoacyl peptidase